MKQEIKYDRETNYIDKITPSIVDQMKSDACSITFRWELPDKRNIFLYIFLSIKLDHSGRKFILAKTNMDSSSVKGQGKHLWHFLLATLEYISQNGYKNLRPHPLLHEVLPNAYALHLVENSEGYVFKNGSYYKLYEGK